MESINFLNFPIKARACETIVTYVGKDLCILSFSKIGVDVWNNIQQVKPIRVVSNINPNLVFRSLALFIGSYGVFNIFKRLKSLEMKVESLVEQNLRIRSSIGFFNESVRTLLDRSINLQSNNLNTGKKIEKIEFDNNFKIFLNVIYSNSLERRVKVLETFLVDKVNLLLEEVDLIRQK